jgi:hypothetical protein
MFTLTTQAHAQAGIDWLLRFAQAWGLVTPGVHAWNLMSDYEEIQITCGVQSYHSSLWDSYAGLATTVIRDAWISPLNYQTYFRTTYYTPSTGWQTDYGAFPFSIEKRNYDCTRYNGGQVLYRQIISSDTTLWLQHAISRWPTQQINTGPASLPVTVNWWFNTLLTGCTGSTASSLTSSMHTVGRNSTRRDIPVPALNIEITGMQWGWAH